MNHHPVINHPPNGAAVADAKAGDGANLPMLLNTLLVVIIRMIAIAVDVKEGEVDSVEGVGVVVEEAI